ncbi:MAG: hypothetical protein A2V88_04595 [Elusimicrobia bacterium RBG_16_66_12]|nr:MAG: hypothetical protein A2V88_04595 [Elusimicrobia bacterium RBG_16_66_12]
MNRRGQAMTETVLLFPLFMFFLFAFAKIFALLILVQKIEIASTYAARRWQLESHRNAAWEGWDDGTLRQDIQAKVLSYIGYGSASVSMNWGSSQTGGNTSQASVSNFLDLTPSCKNGKVPGVAVQRTQVWNVVTVTVCTKPLSMPFYKTTGFVFESTKYVPNRDRPIAFILPGLAP